MGQNGVYKFQNGPYILKKAHWFQTLFSIPTTEI